MIVRPGDDPDLVAIIPTLGDRPDRLAECIDGIEAASVGRRVSVIVIVNNAAVDLSLAHSEVETVLVGMNLGWAGGLNLGRALFGAPLLWLVQDDMVARPDCLDELVATLGSDESLAMVSPVVIGADGLVPVGSGGGYFPPGSAIATSYPPTATTPRELAHHPELSFVPSRGMLIRTTAWDAVGGVDARLYPVQLVDVDLCFALSAAGYRFELSRSAYVFHGVENRNGSTPRAFANFLLHRNLEVVIGKWRPGVAQPEAIAGRPSPAGSLTGVIDERVPRELLEQVAQSAADVVLHLGRHLQRELSERDARIEVLEGQLAEAQRWVEVARRERDAALATPARRVPADDVG